MEKARFEPFLYSKKLVVEISFDVEDQILVDRGDAIARLKK